jgi:hypothetical protein
MRIPIDEQEIHREGKEYKYRHRLKLFCLVVSAKNFLANIQKGLECLLFWKTESGQAGVFERYGYVNLSEYSIQEKLLISLSTIRMIGGFLRLMIHVMGLVGMKLSSSDI